MPKCSILPPNDHIMKTTELIKTVTLRYTIRTEPPNSQNSFKRPKRQVWSKKTTFSDQRLVQCLPYRILGTFIYLCLELMI